MKKGGPKKAAGGPPVDPKAPGGKYGPPKGKAAAAKKSGGKKKKDETTHHKNTFWTHIYHKYIHADMVVLQNPEVKSAVEAMGLTQKHLKQLKLQFEEIDLDGSGSIDSEEFFEILEENRSPFTDALFALIDLDGSGTIEFEEYCMVCITYCMYTRKDILKFVFDCFDKDGSGTIDEKEFITLCNTVNNAAPLFPGNFAEAIAQFDTNDDGLIDFNEFMELDKRYPLVLFPAFRLQDRMMKKTLGEREWVRVHEYINRQRNIKEYMDAHGGQRPPDSFWTKQMKKFCGCLVKKERNVDIDKVAAAQKDTAKRMKNNEDKKASAVKSGKSSVNKDS
jgi:Ca2+-binding EF-hand superfamily protein